MLVIIPIFGDAPCKSTFSTAPAQVHGDTASGGHADFAVSVSRERRNATPPWSTAGCAAASRGTSWIVLHHGDALHAVAVGAMLVTFWAMYTSIPLITDMTAIRGGGGQDDASSVRNCAACPRGGIGRRRSPASQNDACVSFIALTNHSEIS